MTMKLIPVKDHPNLMKDKGTGAIVNVNSDAAHAARERKKRLQEDQERVKKLENDVTEIKQLLLQLIGKEENG